MAEKQTITALFFASLAESVGAPQIEVAASAQNLTELLATLVAQLGSDACAGLSGDNVRVAVNHELVAKDTSYADIRLSAGDVVAFLPPVTGG